MIEKNIPCVILAAGEGKRMRPLTTNCPKVMLPLINRPILEHLIYAVRDAGLVNFIIVIGYGEDKIREHFGDGTKFGIHIRYVLQQQQHGTADALRSVRDLISEDFLLLNGDAILKTIDIIELCKCNAPCMGISTTNHPEDYGAVVVENNYIISIEEKSKHPLSNVINAGVYILSPDIFDEVDKVQTSRRGEFELTDALFDYIVKKKLLAYPLSYWMDVGDPWDMLDVNLSLMEILSSDIRGVVEEGVSIHGSVIIGEGSVVKSGTCIEGPCIIGKNCRIGPHAYIRGATSIGDNCHIGYCTELKNSIVMSETHIPHFNYVGDSIIGSKCNFGAGTKIANLRHDNANVNVCGRDTRRKKFGAIIGDGVQFGINCSVNVGTIIGSNARFAPNSYISGCIGENTMLW
jgi:UDP-N-acetylglucosamine diphosphorylase / glucose-1-phosphate thymidylyltransferase / UDP-N-acetylgalactosamine diphosphorylase / glucosamine-1-phosphate N-acetyltransferase / galactosamine-1-phosphate N-acetyltransferase